MVVISGFPVPLLVCVSQLNMASSHDCKLEYRSVIKFLCREGSSATKIRSRIVNVYASECPSYTTVTRRFNEFEPSRVGVQYDPRSRRPSTSTDLDHSGRARSLIWRITELSWPRLLQNWRTYCMTVLSQSSTMFWICRRSRHNGGHGTSLRKMGTTYCIHRESFWASMRATQNIFSPSLWLRMTWLYQCDP